MRTYPSSYETCLHEAHHCASLICAGLVPQYVRSDWPTERQAGKVKLDWENWDISRESMYAVTLAVMQAPLAEGRFLDDWPLNLDQWADLGGCHQDAVALAHLTARLGFDGVDWHFAIYRANQQARTSRYRRLLAAITRELEAKELLLRHELEQIVAEVDGAAGH
jgi:hypothetical protein